MPGIPHRGYPDYDPIMYYLTKVIGQSYTSKAPKIPGEAYEQRITY